MKIFVSLALICAAASSAPVFAQNMDSFAGIMNPMAREHSSLRLRLADYPDTILGNFSANIVAYHDAKNSFSLNGTFSDLHSNTNINLPKGPAPVPSDLKSELFGVNYTRTLGAENFWGASVGYGSSSDQPFSEADVDVVNANIYYGFPSSPESSWVLLLNYSNNRALANNIPLPGFAYIYHPSEDFHLVLGIPFALVDWKFAPNWAMAIYQFGITKSHAEISRSLGKPVRIFLAGDFDQVPYLRKGRLVANDRLTYDEKKVSLGLRSPLSAAIFAELSGGYAFDRSFFEADRYWNRNGNRTPLNNGAFIAAQLSARL